MKKLYGFAVCKCGVSPEYFMDEMSNSELEAISDSYYDIFKDEWEKTRAIVHAVISSQSTKPVPIEKTMPFEWDKERKPDKPKTTTSDLERIKNKM